jgi:hypothetical protein
MQSKRQRHQPACMVAHAQLNKLAAIIGNCDLLIEKTEQGTEYARRLGLIREIADSAVKELTEHQQQVEEETRRSGGRRAG